MSAARKYRHLQVVEGGRAGATLTERMVTLHCQECGNRFRYRYAGVGPFRSFCRKCRPNATHWKKG